MRVFIFDGHEDCISEEEIIFLLISYNAPTACVTGVATVTLVLECDEAGQEVWGPKTPRPPAAKPAGSRASGSDCCRITQAVGATFSRGQAL